MIERLPEDLNLNSEFNIEGDSSLSRILGTLENHLAQEKKLNPMPNYAIFKEYEAVDNFIQIKLSQLGFNGSTSVLNTEVKIGDDVDDYEDVRTVTRTLGLESSTYGPLGFVSYRMVMEIIQYEHQMEEVKKFSFDAKNGIYWVEVETEGSDETVMIVQRSGYASLITISLEDEEEVRDMIGSMVGKSSNRSFKAAQAGARRPLKGGAPGLKG